VVHGEDRPPVAADPGAIPEDIRLFLLGHIDSISQWEGLLLLRADSQREWSPAEAAAKLYIDERQAAHLLSQLAERNVLASIKVQTGLLYRYQPHSPEMAEAIDHAAAFYRDHLIPMTRFIHAKPKARLQEFADAFKLRKD
jgi:hypothetical protein